MPSDGGSRRGAVLDRPPHREGASGRRRALPLILVALAALIARLACAAEEAPDGTPAAAQTAKFSPAQIEQLVAPIALYPDGLAVQVLIAATYPLEVVEAARWRTKNASLKGEALDQALESQDWDPSVESLTRFPDLLQRMSDNLDWTKDLGDAFLDQKDEVLDTVQRMRAKAYESGALKTTKEQVVTREIVKEKEIIRVEPADPQVVYVPTYSPDAVYGPPPTPYYPAMTGYPPGYVATASLLSFGAGMAVGAAVWGDCDWGHNEVNNYYNNGGGGGGNQNVNVNKNKEKNVNKSGNRTRGEGGRQKWQHNPEHRGGVPYRDQASAKKYGGRDQVASRDRANRDVARGFDRGQPGGARASQQPARGGSKEAASRPGAGPGQGGGRPSAPGGQPGRQGGQRPGASQQPATRPGGSGSRPDRRQGGAFGGYESGRSSREASARGASSRGGTSYAGRGGGQRGGGGGGGGRGGGGFGGGGGGGGRGGGGRGGGGRGGRR